ncbi:hypothetical protein [Ancylobacter terrae]|uniref:hypothetical protein n=1 Tax=Ancylobacter sp. sgz301288 TaxID=3342077 RepID=UPI003859B737
MSRVASRCWRLGPLARVAVVLASALLPSMAVAHSGGSAEGPRSGLSIPPISHGEMALVDERLDEIVALARRQSATDGPIRRLYNHFGVQLAYCFWGLAPGGVTREDSPFNACAHAYLATAKVLLVEMSRQPASSHAALAILDRLEARRRETPEAGEICSSSGEAFNTASVVRPRLAEMVADPGVAAIILGVMLLLAGGGVAAGSLRRSSSGSESRLD